MNEFFTWAMLATFAGATAATAIVTQFLKDIKFLTDFPTQLLSYIVALVVLVIATLATIGFGDWQTFAIIPLNAVVVSLASNGGFEAIQKLLGNKN